MEKENGGSISLSKDGESVGSVQIADEVVAMIAYLAAMEVEGVSGPDDSGFLGKSGAKGLAKIVKVAVSEGEVSLELTLRIDYGRSIPAISQKVQERVRNAIENMTGLKVTDVGLRIDGVNMDAVK